MNITNIIALCRRLQPVEYHREEVKRPVQQQKNDTIPKYFRDIRLDALLDGTDRSKNSTSGDGHNNCGFNAILEQVGDHTHTHEMVNLLRHKLGYGNENSNQMFDTNSCLSVANLFKRPVSEICHNGGKTTQISFSVPSIDLSIHFRNEMELSQNFVQWCKISEWKQDSIDELSQWLAANLPNTFDFNEITVYDISLRLLQYSKAIVLISVDSGGHFDAAPHKDLQRENSVLDFLCKTES
ncbi:MAG: hypothetical protein LBC11_02880 [Puniceicoccales bacterium]|jgi:hypothetical protein|nr:hypothetical protein [Puniceicoccales bacterium]